jgi:hypothetical protein
MNKLLNRIKTKPGYKFLAVILVIVGLFHVAYINSPEHKVKTGEKVLVCEFAGGREESIDPKLIVAYDGEKDMWVFTNGYSHNCYLIDNKKDHK